MKTRRILTLVLAFTFIISAVLFTFASCSNDDNSSNDTTSSEGSATEETGESDASEAPETTTATPETTPAPTTTAAPIEIEYKDTFRINCGGDEYTDLNGNVWDADDYYYKGKHGYLDGNIATYSDVVCADTEFPELYLSLTWMSILEYQFDDIKPGKYNVKLFMAETHYNDGDAMARQFDIYINDKLYEKDVNPSVMVTKWHAVERTFTVEVAEGKPLTISLEASIDNGSLCGLEITPAGNAELSKPIE